MKDIGLKIRQHPNYKSALKFGKLISITGSAQIFIQLVGFASGILIIRLLPVEEYGLYTLANTMLGTMIVLGDGGLSTGIMSQGAKVWQDKKKLGAVLATGLNLRSKFATVSFIVVMPIMIYLLMHNNASWWISLIITFSLLPAFYGALSDSLIEIVPKLHQDIFPLQKNQIFVSLLRLLLIGILMFILPFAFIAMLANGIPRIIGNIKLKKIANKFVEPTDKVDLEVRSEILKIVKKILPGSIYFCLSGQISIWIISFFGNTVGVAQLGALGRIAMILNMFTVLINTLIIPRFARLEAQKVKLLTSMLYTMGIVLVISLGLMLFVNLFPSQILFILGESYKNLDNEMILSILIACINLATTILNYLTLSRGWVMNPFLMMAFNLIGTIFPFFLVDYTTLQGVLMLSLYSAIYGFLINGGYITLKIFKLEN